MLAHRAFAAAQTTPTRGEVDANMDEHLRLARVAADAGARVVVFPELSLTGYELDLGEKLAFSEDDARLAPLIDLGSEANLTLVVGAPIRLVPQLHIGAFIITPDGGVDVYTKRHLGAFSPDANPTGSVPPPEATFFAPGDRDPSLMLGGDIAAVAVCADTGRASHPQAAADRGATVYLASMFFRHGELDAEAGRLGGYAAAHRMTVVMANYGGPTGGLTSGGGSSIWSADGELLVQLGARGSGVAIAVQDETGWRTNVIMLGA
jgi:predicted amidohydrolase